MAGMPNSSAVLTRLKEVIGHDLDQTNRFILEHLDSQVALIPELGSHLINSGGKRLRPILTLLSARLSGYEGDEHALLAAVIEFIHTATLLHDDVVDHSHTRRGRLTANAVWGSKAPILVGDFLFSRSFQILVNFGSLRVLRIIADACAVISEGEVMQLVTSNDLSTTEQKYLEVVKCKTATLFAAAAQLGAVLAQLSPEDEQCLARFGLQLGNAYQLVDDALDYSANQEELGKTIGNDFQEGKITLPVIHAFRHGTPDEQEFWRQSLEHKGEKSEESLKKAMQLIHQRNSLHYALDIAKTFVQDALAQLAPFPDCPEKEALIMLAEFSVSRRF